MFPQGTTGNSLGSETSLDSSDVFLFEAQLDLGDSKALKNAITLLLRTLHESGYRRRRTSTGQGWTSQVPADGELNSSHQASQ